VRSAYCSGSPDGERSELLGKRYEDNMMKLSARNQLKGKIVEVIKGTTTSHVRVDIGHGVIITSSITNEAVADLGLKNGDEAWAVIKASDVMIGK
jgi:molybdopterin-binding protein